MFKLISIGIPYSNNKITNSLLIDCVFINYFSFIFTFHFVFSNNEWFKTICPAILLLKYGIPMKTNLNIDYITFLKSYVPFQFFWITS